MQDALSAEEKKEIRETFDLFDKDKDGHIEVAEMETVIRALFMVSSDAAVTEMLHQLDTDKSGTVEYGEFEKYVVDNKLMRFSPDDLDDNMRDAFQVFDKDGDGVIDVEEFRDVMSGMGDKLSLEEVEAMMSEADTNRDGKIDYAEFCQHMKNNL